MASLISAQKTSVGGVGCSASFTEWWLYSFVGYIVAATQDQSKYCIFMKIALKFIGCIFFVYWFFLMHVSFNQTSNDFVDNEYSTNHQFKVATKRILPVNAIGLFCMLTTEAPVYFVLYDSHGRYIGQSSPFVCYSAWSSVRFIFPNDDFSSSVNSFTVFDA